VHPEKSLLTDWQLPSTASCWSFARFLRRIHVIEDEGLENDGRIRYSVLHQLPSRLRQLPQLACSLPGAGEASNQCRLLHELNTMLFQTSRHTDRTRLGTADSDSQLQDDLAAS